MSLKRRATRRDGNESQLVALARKLGWKLWNIEHPSDWMGAHAGKLHAIEIKMPGKPLTDDQERLSEDLDSVGCTLLVWRDEGDVIASTEDP